MKHFNQIFVSLLLILVFINSAVYGTDDWTIMVYIAGDNNLGDPTEPFDRNYALKDLNEMEGALYGVNANVIVLMDQ